MGRYHTPGLGTPFDRRAFLAGSALAALAPLGCLGKHFARKDAAAVGPPPGRIVSVWDNKVVYAPDAAHGGAPMPGLLGRIYLFGPDMAVPYIGDGSLIVTLYDSSPRGDGSEPQATDNFTVDPASLKLFAKKDFVGDGYTIFFPWFNYNLGTTRAYLQALYTAADGKSYFHQSDNFAVDHAETREMIKKGMLKGPQFVKATP